MVFSEHTPQPWMDGIQQVEENTERFAPIPNKPPIPGHIDSNNNTPTIIVTDVRTDRTRIGAEFPDPTSLVNRQEGVYTSGGSNSTQLSDDKNTRGPISKRRDFGQQAEKQNIGPVPKAQGVFVDPRIEEEVVRNTTYYKLGAGVMSAGVAVGSYYYWNKEYN